MSVEVIRNGIKLCEKCREKDCMRRLCGADDEEVDYVSDEPCECCELEVEIDDGFGI